MTESERVSMEHIAHRRRVDGWTWGEIIAEARMVLGDMGLAIPITMDRAWELERAYSRAYEAVQSGRCAS